jgi:hypothetical protein
MINIKEIESTINNIINDLVKTLDETPDVKTMRSPSVAKQFITLLDLYYKHTNNLSEEII